MPGENTEQLFVLMPIKTKIQGISMNLAAALDSKLAGSSNAYIENMEVCPLLKFRTDDANAEEL
ncbi:hypothetical protein BPAE_0284g00020 [Botrytis paeoniae]|uniref:Uncharacterized protein n=1 Tax=Botrytis paeoniae TaxID=278948 RepID=A0A4Z1F7P3_9HELO|nr:hypothetical protein BPAE_0284g00020 [Botrytis paeoniae]